MRGGARMSKVSCFIFYACLSFIAMGSDECVKFHVEATNSGRTLPNPSQMLCLWSMPKSDFFKGKKNSRYDVTEFAEFVEIMGASGGTYGRDCFKKPADRSVVDDYDFTHMIDGCRGILSSGLKPYLKLGNVPVKMSSKALYGGFGMNVHPPDDFAVYGRYMTACANALLSAFGREELCRWRFAVLTEYENDSWFKDVSNDPEKSFQAYCKLYETTVDAFVKCISPDISIGVHAMACQKGHWDERRFIYHVAERKLPLKFITVSFYDRQPGLPAAELSLTQSIEHMRSAAESVGFSNLVYGVEEGRILWGATRKKSADNLLLRIVGDTYQAAYDARTVKQMFDSGADWFASWGYLSGPNTFFEGLPSVSFHVAKNAAKFKGMNRLQVSKTGGASVETDSVAAISDDGSRIRIMTYAFKDALFATGVVPVKVSVALPSHWKGRLVTLESCQIDDSANWFDEWRTERKKRGITDDRFDWSPDDPAPMSSKGLKSAKDRKMFVDELEPQFHKVAQLKNRSAQITVGESGLLQFSHKLPINAVLFAEFRLEKNLAVRPAIHVHAPELRTCPFECAEGVRISPAVVFRDAECIFRLR
jgi:hypothetical protein